MAGLIADQFGLSAAIAAIGALTFASGALVAIAMNGRSKDQHAHITQPDGDDAH
jgi:hypothetical protein